MTKKYLIISSLVLAFIAEAFLILIIYFNPYKIAPMIPTELQSWLSAGLNLLSALSLLYAYMAIKKQEKQKHKKFIHLALCFSALFLINYILYHMSIGHVKFTNQDFRVLYLFILATHLICSMISLPLIFMTYTLGIFNYLKEHKKIAKIAFCLWEYVSVTGVMVVLMLKFLNS